MVFHVPYSFSNITQHASSCSIIVLVYLLKTRTPSAKLDLVLGIERKHDTRPAPIEYA